MKKILLSCGGTGGHIYPAIAIASCIKKHQEDAEILFIGTKKGMENSLVPKAGFKIEGIEASGINRRHPLKNIKTIEDAIKGSKEAANIIESFKPDVAIGTGGYVTGTVIMQAHKRKIPCFIHEQNAIPGLTNKLLERYVDKVFISFLQSQKSFKNIQKTILTGNPIRSQFEDLSKEECKASLGFDKDETLVLLFGGSLGAEVLNKAALSFIEKLPKTGVKFCFVTGKRYFEAIKKEATKSPSLMLLDYADNMPVLMKAADIVISRAGAIAVSEILACEKPSILIPSPNVTHNHQYFNAKAIADEGASILIEEKDLKESFNSFNTAVLKLIQDNSLRENMAKAAKKLAITDASEKIYQNLGIE